MQRKNFLRFSLLGAGIVASSKGMANLVENDIDELKPLEVLGFNHIPNPNTPVMNNMVIHRAGTRGHANHGWLDSHHTFSFANYYNPERMHFGVLRVLNDDIVAAGRGFGTHPHDNMEIISIPLSGDLEHKDSMGNTAVIKQGDIQVMSAGTGITHSEYNRNPDSEVRFLQIWLFPNKKNVTPRYDQIKLDTAKMHNNLLQVLSPKADDDGVWIHQDAWFHLGQLDKGFKTAYKINRPATNGVYAFLLDGSANINGQELQKRDGLGLWSIEKLDIEATSDARLLLMEVPMQL
ncbi:MAG: pirin family protein [Saprospiraceae bacterium]|nr:pirin family protein [Saprospiraceae bacterium]